VAAAGAAGASGAVSNGGRQGLGGSPPSGAGGAAGAGPTSGSGGSAGLSGAAGTDTAGAGGTGTSGGPGCPEGAVLCDDFEASLLGAFPNGPAWDPNSCTSHVVDGSVAHTGTQSLRGGAEQYPACMAHADVAAESEMYARSWIRLGGASSDSGHEIGVLEFGPTAADNPELRVGLRNNDSVCASNPGVEVTVDGVAGGERTVCTGVPLDAERWYCLEVHFSRSPGRIAFGVQIDGASVVPETEYTDAMPAWNDGPMFLKLGRSSYGGNNIWPVWHDDVVLANQPVGCAP
jgi:hypothetical protein